MFQLSVLVRFLLTLLLSPIGRSAYVLPKSPTEFTCNDNAIPVEDKQKLAEDLYVGGVKQTIEGSDSEKVETAKQIMNMSLYMLDLKKTHPDDAQKCKNTHELCAFWASVGKCDTNRIYMLRNCAPACRFCILANTNMGEYFDP